VQPFQPNLQLFAGALQMKQTKYDTNRKQISDLYGSLLNSPMSRDSNIEARDEFFKSIDYEIKKLTNVDLSLEQNVNQAATLFNSMYDNKNLVKDMLWTKNYNNEMQRAEGFKNCLDPEKCGGQYWEGGVQALEWRRDEFRKASDDNAMMMGDVNYTPYVNVQDMAAKMFKELDWDVKVDTPDGNWLVTTKNGENIMGNLLVHFQKTLGEDPRIQEYYKTKAYLERKNWAGSNAAQYGSQEAAEQEYINQTTRLINESLSKAKDNAEHKKNTNKQIANDLKENIDKGDVRYDQEMQKVMDDLYSDADTYEYSENQIGNTVGTVNNSISSRTLSLQGEALDGALAMTMLDQDLGVAAQIMAFKNYERTLKENPIAMKYQEHLWRMQEAAAGQKATEEEDDDVTDLLNDYLSGGIKQEVNLDPNAAYKQIAEETKEEIERAKTPTLEVLTRTFTVAQQQAKDGGNGSAQAGKDIVALVDQAVRSYANQAKYSKNSDKYEYGQKLLKNWNSKSEGEKLGWAKTWDMDKFSQGLHFDAANKVFSVAQTFHENNKYNQANRTYLSTLNGEIAGLIGEAEQGEINVTEWRKTMKNMTAAVQKQLRTTGGSASSPYYEYLVNSNGDERSEKSFSYTAAKGQIAKQFGYAEGANVVDRFKAVNLNDYSSIKTAATERYNMMSPERQKEVGGKDKYVYKNLYDNAVKDQDANPNVKIVENGQTKYIPVDQFFTTDGLVRSKYDKYKDNWKRDLNSKFWYQYDYASKLYSGKVDSEGNETGLGQQSKVDDIARGLYGLAFGGIQGAVEQVQKGRMSELQELNNARKKNDSPFLNDYRQAFPAAIDELKQNGELRGFGSYVQKDLFGFVDYSDPKSKTVIGEVTFLKDAFDAEDTGNAFFSFGGPGSLPTETNREATAVLKQLIGQAKKSQDKESRPTWVGTYNGIGGGKEDWQMYTIKVDDPKFAAMFGKSPAEGIEGMAKDFLPAEGGRGSGSITIYLKDEVATNELHKATKRGSLTKRLEYSDKQDFKFGYGLDALHNLKIVRKGSGYVVTGGLADNIREDGSYNLKQVYHDYSGSGYSPDAIQEEYLRKIAIINMQLNN
jgi:hypothetical protein